MRIRSFLFILLTLLVASAGCTNQNYPEAAKIVLWSSDVTGGDFAVPKGKGIIVAVTPYDEAGNALPLDISRLEWKSDNTKFLSVSPLGSGCVVYGIRDWYDIKDEYGRVYYEEPTAKIRVTYGAAHAEIDVRVVINVSGTWGVTISDRATREIELNQQGRSITYAGSSGAERGSINGNKVKLQQLGLDLSGSLSSHTEGSGTYVGPYDTYGWWRATKRP